MEIICRKTKSNAIVPARKHGDSYGYEVSNIFTTQIPKEEVTKATVGFKLEGGENVLALFTGQFPHHGNENIEVCQGFFGFGCEIKLAICNHSDDEVEIPAYTVLSKVLILKTMGGDVNIVDSLDQTIRGEKGFGSSGFL